ncbi:uncharacterized protein [Drosophila takahashii]|uniref:uncharacterized protein n=1 Tax=Drosophila takahashii TaxID=29030 RepID=UPI001CF8B05A|nr:uncharacterized protein LOC108068783 [Drosophila takahashii]
MDEELANPPVDPSIEPSDYSRGRFVSRSTITLTRGMDSTRLLYMGDNFQQTRSDQDIFFDCQGPAEDSPKEGRSAASRCKLDDPAAIREALERAANATQMLLKNFDKAGGWNQPCAVTLELTARLVDPKKGRAGCPLHGKPVTVQMPLEFNPQSGRGLTCQQKHPPPRKESICQCRSHHQAMRPASRAPKANSECPALMYVQHERHSDSDPNSRHQQTEQSYLKDHWKPSKTPQSEPSECEDPHAKPSQTEASYLREHHTPKNPQSQPQSEVPLEEVGPSCSCKDKRSKSADPPAVKNPPTCTCHTETLPCGMGKPAVQKKPCSVRTSLSERSGQASSFKSALTACTKELIDHSCTCGSSQPPYWAGQSNVVSGQSMDPSHSKASEPYFMSNFTIAPLGEPGKPKSKHSRSKSLASLPDKSSRPNQSGVTWLSALKDPDTEGCPSNATQTNQDQSMSSFPPSQTNYRSMTTKSSASRSRNPYSQPSFGLDVDTSATTRSQSIVGKITCLCGSEQQPNFVAKLTHQDCLECAGESRIQPCASTRIQHPSGFSQFEDCQEPGASFRSRKVSMKDHEGEFCDCDDSDKSSDLSDPIQTSLHTHRSLSGGSCLCNDDEPPGQDPSKSECVSKECQCYLKDDLPEMQSAQEGTGFQTPEDLCGNKSMACCTRKQRIMQLMEKLTSSGCDCGESRACLIQQLFREMTLLLRSEKEDAVAPADEPSPPCLHFDECCAAQHDGKNEEEPGEKPMSKRQIQRVECFHQLEEYLRKCYLPPPEPEIPETDIYAFELDPDFPPDEEPQKPCNESGKMPPCQEKYFNLGNPLTCSGDGLDGDFFRDCEEVEEEEHKCDCKEECQTTEPQDLCQSLRAFIDKELQEILEAEKQKEGNELEPQKTPSIILKEICEGSATKVPSEREEKTDPVECPFAGMVSCPRKDWASYPYNFDPCAQKDPGPKAPRTGLLPDGPLPPSVRNLCEQLLRKALKDCGLCGGDETTLHSCEEEEAVECPPECDPCKEDGPLEECPDECPQECPDEGEEEECLACLTKEAPEQGCLCCHCRALICDEECKTVSKTLRSAMCDPLCEMKYFIDSMIIDLHAMDCVLGNKQAKPKNIRANDATNRTGPGDSFPATISCVTSLGCTALYVRWKVEDCRAIAGFEIYVDGHLTNRFYSFRHEAGVITNVDVTNPHQIVLRAQAVGQDFPGEDGGRGKPQECGCRAVALSHPELSAGAERPWMPSVFYYDPNQLPPDGGGQKC